MFACAFSPVCSKFLIGTLFDLVRYHLSYNEALEVNWIRTIHRIECPHRDVVHVYIKVFSMDAIEHS